MAKIINQWEFEHHKGIRELRAGLKKNPNSPELHFELGRRLFRLFKPEAELEGLKHIQKAIKLKPDFAEAIEFLAISIIENEPIKGSRLAQKAASLYRAKGEAEKANSILNRASLHYVFNGWESLDGDDLITAKKKAERALKIYPQCVDAKNILASIHMNRFEFKAAEMIYSEAVSDAVAQQGGKIKIEGMPYWGDIDSRPYMRARHGLGLCYMHNGRFQDALKEFKTLLDLNPNDNQGIRFLLADVYFYIGGIKEAEKYYKKYGDDDGAYNYALFLFSMGKRDKAIDFLKKGIKESPFIAVMLKAYLKMFEFWIERKLYNAGETPPLFMHRNAVINAWNENIELAKDYMTNRNLKSACDFCSLYGSLWLRYKGSYMFLLEGIDAAS